MNFNSNKLQGNFGLGIAIAYFTSNLYTVSIPLTDTQDYDLIIEQNNILQTVQVKTTRCKTKYNTYQVALKSTGGTKGTTYKTVINTHVDLLCIITDYIDIYLIPVKMLSNISKINLCNKYQKYKVK